MRRFNAVLVVIAAGTLAACQTAADRKKAEDTSSQSPQQSAPAAAPVAVAPTDTAPVATTVPEAGAAPDAALPAGEPAATPAPVRRAPRASSHARTAQAPAPPRTVYTTRRTDRVEPLDLPQEDASTTDDKAARADAGVEVQAPRHDVLVIPAGTELRLILENALSSETSQKGDAVTARVERATGADGRVILPGGTVLKGSVYRADRAGRVRGRSQLSVDFNRIVVRGVEHRLDTTAISVEGPESRGRDAAVIGGGTVGGAIIGGILGGGRGARRGAVVGAAGGTGAVLVTRGKDVELPAGSRWTVRVKDRVRLD